MTLHDALHPRLDVDKLYMTRKGDGGGVGVGEEEEDEKDSEGSEVLRVTLMSNFRRICKQVV